MTINLPYKVRAAIYIGNIFLAPLMSFLLLQDVINEAAFALYSAEAAAAFALAGLNITKNS